MTAERSVLLGLNCIVTQACIFVLFFQNTRGLFICVCCDVTGSFFVAGWVGWGLLKSGRVPSNQVRFFQRVIGRGLGWLHCGCVVCDAFLCWFVPDSVVLHHIASHLETLVYLQLDRMQVCQATGSLGSQDGWKMHIPV